VPGRGGLTDHPAWSAVAGAATGAVIALALGLGGLLPSAGGASPADGAGGGAAPATTVTGADAVDGFLAAWRAHLMASWSVDEIDQRTTAKGAVVRFEVHQAQNPPDSIEIGNGTVSARRGATEVACGPAPSGTGLTCRSAPSPLTWSQSVDRQLALLRTDLSGPAPYYRVTGTPDGCWSLTLAVPPSAAPVAIGLGSTYCLDPATLALRSSRVQRAGAVDVVSVTDAHAPATAADLALPANVTTG